MKNRVIGSMVAAAVLLFTPNPAVAQAAAGAALPRTADGKPNLSGVWQVLNAAAWDLLGHEASKGVPAGRSVVDGNEIPYTPAAAAKKKLNFENRATLDPEAKCFLPGVPRITYMPYPFQIFQTPAAVTILYEYNHAFRNVYTNGTQHPKGHIDWWMGDSRGRWEGDTLVVDVVDFNEETWFDRAGNFHSDALHLVERYTLMDPDHINYEVTVEDPKVFTRPWKMNMTLYRRQEKNVQILDYECNALEEEAAGRIK
jgi:hypothetical protein